MRYKLISLIATTGLLASSFSSSGMPAHPGKRVAQQKDGTELSLFLVGDESFHVYVTTDGKTVGRGTDGSFYYHAATGLSECLAHDISMRGERELCRLPQKSDCLKLD